MGARGGPGNFLKIIPASTPNKVFLLTVVGQFHVLGHGAVAQRNGKPREAAGSHGKSWGSQGKPRGGTFLSSDIATEVISCRRHVHAFGISARIVVKVQQQQ